MTIFTIKKKSRRFEVLLDDEDYQRVVDAEKTFGYCWSASGFKNRVTMRVASSWTIQLSRFVLNYDGPLYVDHINHNLLDNQKANLRIVTKRDDMLNSTIPWVVNRI